MTKQELLQKADSLPLSPGVYIMMDKTGLVIYVGKDRNALPAAEKTEE